MVGNRVEQARHFLGVAYTAIRARCDGVAAAEALLTTDRRPSYPKRAAHPVRTRAAGTSAPLGTEHCWPVRADYPLWDLLENPNPQDTRLDLLYEIELQRCLTASALLWQVPNGFNLPAELYVIPTALATALPRSAQYPGGAWRVSPLQASGPFAMLPGPVAAGGAVIPLRRWTQPRCKGPPSLGRLPAYAEDKVRLHYLTLNRSPQSTSECLGAAVRSNHMSPPTGQPPDDKEGLRLVQRLLAGDATASADLAAAYLASLTEWLAATNADIHVDDCSAAADEAIVNLLRNPASFDPTLAGGRLFAFLQMAAHADLRNLLARERRHRTHRKSLLAVEHGEDAGKYLGREDDPSFGLRLAEELDELAPPEVMESLTGIERKVLELMRSGERRTREYAKVMDILHLPPEEQRHEVKKMKDRLKKRCDRADGGADDQSS